MGECSCFGGNLVAGLLEVDGRKERGVEVEVEVEVREKGVECSDLSALRVPPYVLKYSVEKRALADDHVR